MLEKTTILMHPPNAILTEWKVFEVLSRLEAPTLHLVGWTEHSIRVSSPIFECDAIMRTCMTRSKNIYQLMGEPAQELDEVSVVFWNDWVRQYDVVSINDVTEVVAGVFRQVDEERGLLQEDMPPDFPRDSVMGSLPGKQSEFLASQVDGKFLVGPTKKLQQRYQICVRLVAQYHRLHLNFSEEDFLSNDGQTLPSLAEVFVYVALQSWGLSVRERAWIIDRVDSGPKTAGE